MSRLIVSYLLIKLRIWVLDKLFVKLHIVGGLVLFDSEEFRPNDFPELIVDFLPAEQRIEDAHTAIVK